MRALSPLLNKKKRGLSNVIGYVILISITLSLSVMVYAWLRFYVTGEEMEKCSENVNVIIKNYQCFAANSEGDGGSLNITLKNKGLFTVDGYELRVHTRFGAEFGMFLLNDTGTEILPGNEYSDYYEFEREDLRFDIDGDGFIDDKLETITLIEVQPFVLSDDGSGSVRCKSFAIQRVDSCDR